MYSLEASRFVPFGMCCAFPTAGKIRMILYEPLSPSQDALISATYSLTALVIPCFLGRMASVKLLGCLGSRSLVIFVPK